MKKIRLTESQLKSIIKKVINEAEPTYRTGNLDDPSKFPSNNPSPSSSPTPFGLNKPEIKSMPSEKKFETPAAPPTPAPRTPNPKIMKIQQNLVKLGYNLGNTGAGKNGVDGFYGPKTKVAIQTFQRERGLPETGKPDPETLQRITTDLTAKTAPFAQDNPKPYSGQPPVKPSTPVASTPPKTNTEPKQRIKNPLVAASPIGKAINNAKPWVPISQRQYRKS